MKHTPGQPELRLVGAGLSQPAAPRAAVLRPEPTPALIQAGLSRAARAVDHENRAAARADINPTDPRWVLAARAYSQLDGAALSPDRRQRLMRLARQLGIRPFDANVIVALVQDRARRGRSLHDITTTLTMMPIEREHRSPMAWRWIAAVLCAAGAAALLIQWVLGGA